jgi:hypothetical protein
MREEDFVELVKNTINEAVEKAYAEALKPVIQKIMERQKAALKEQQAGSGLSGTGPTPDKPEFMRRCKAAGGNDVSCEIMWHSIVSTLEEAQNLRAVAESTKVNAVGDYKAAVSTVLDRLIEKLQLVTPLKEGEREPETALGRYQRRKDRGIA